MVITPKGDAQVKDEGNSPNAKRIRRQRSPPQRRRTSRARMVSNGGSCRAAVGAIESATPRNLDRRRRCRPHQRRLQRSRLQRDPEFAKAKKAIGGSCRLGPPRARGAAATTPAGISACAAGISFEVSKWIGLCQLVPNQPPASSAPKNLRRRARSDISEAAAAGALHYGRPALPPREPRRHRPSSRLCVA